MKRFLALLLFTVLLLAGCLQAEEPDVINTDGHIDYVLIDGEKYLTIAVTKRDIPGEIPGVGRIDLITDSNIVIDHDSVEYVINEDGTYADKRTLPDETLLYGIYREENNTVSVKGYTIYHLVALYSFDPR